MAATTIAPESFKPLIIRALVLPLVLIVAFAGVILWQLNRLIAVQWWVEHTDQVIAQANELRFYHTEMESALRGFLITSDPAVRGPYDAARKFTGPASLALQKLVSDNPPQVEKLRFVEGLRAQWTDYVEKEMQLRAANGPWEAAVRAGIANNLMAQIRDQLSQFIGSEQALRQQRTQAVHDTVVYSLWFTGAMVLLVGSGLTLVSKRQFSLLVETYGHALQTANEAAAVLERRVAQRTEELASTNARLVEEAILRQRASDAMAEINGRLQISNRELQDFASVASHDLQEPLRKVQAFGDRLRSKSAAQLGPEGLDYVERMLNAAVRMKTLINDLLTFARVTSRAQPFVPVDLQAVAEQVLSDLETRIEESGGKVNIGPMPQIDADVTQMRQVFQNLLGNALKFSKAGKSPQVDVWSEVGGEGEAAVVKVNVRDNGIGFDEKYTDRIFTVFQRLHGRQEYEGTGIGLAVCRKIVERHRGTITVISKPGEGATFTVTLPVRQEHTLATDSPASIPAPAPAKGAA